MSRKIVQNNQVSEKDENGIYKIVNAGQTILIDPTNQKIESDISIDNLLARGLDAINRAMKSLSRQITADTFDKDTIDMLKACMQMLHELKKKENEILEEMSDEDLKKLAKQKK